MNGILTDNGDIKIINGKIALGDIRGDVVERVLTMQPGEMHDAPTIGIGIITQQHATHNRFLTGKIKDQLSAENITTGTVSITKEGINIEIR